MKIRNNYILGLNGLVKLLWIIIVAGACQNDDGYDVPQNDSPVLVEFSVATSGVNDASGSSTDIDARITSIYILQFNATGESYGTLRYVAKGTETSGGKFTATLLQSMGADDNYKLVILANLPDYGFLYGMYGMTYDEVQQACLSKESTSPLVFDDTHPFPMFGVVNGGVSVQVQKNTLYTNTELIRAVARVDLGIGTKNTNPNGTVSWTNTGSGKQPFVMTEVQVWKAGKRYAYMPAVGNYHWNSVTTGSVTSNQIAIDSPSAATGGTTTMTYGDSYITNKTYCLGQIYLPEADLLWGSVFDSDHTNRLAIIVGGYYNGSADLSYYRVDFTNDDSGGKMNILRNHVYQFTIKKVEAAGYGTAELAYNSKPKNLGFEATLEPWTTGQASSVPSIQGYYLSYQGFNGENVDWTYAAGSSQRIPKKRFYWINSQMPFDYGNFYKEGNKFYFPDIMGEQNGELYATVSDALNYEGTFPSLMVSGDDVVDESGSETIPWKEGTTLTAFDLCRNLEKDGYGDWRLPRLSELAFIYVNQGSLKALRGFIPLSGTYWCGSEYLVANATDEQRKKSDWAWAFDFTDVSGYASWHQKTDKLKIRCVRQKLDNK
ncbi:DUF1566 domain-containing protein [Bacteroides sp. GM023]|uniref:Lcl domain-containing protein n=1 Tax=Bacteroides sp. GM023 TaxID=2723058 RepID=UPI00168BAA84|nr:DUF1566 domain-containing protein [Bacteroides sp. GM023]MBD3591307.1 DUF1566 domain-containing protein [Bacteroides sp. GM023]